MELQEEVPTSVDPAVVSAELARQVTENPIFREAYKQIKFLDVFVNTLTGYIERVAARQEEMALP